tara:strand:- start:3600 stop:4565 length:966 start_codon:yes stop_codon:yes gene_type:complete
MNIDKILIVLGEPYSVFSEILFKYLRTRNYKKNKKKIIIIGNLRLLINQMRKLKYKYSFNEIKNYKEAKSGKLNIINIKFKFSKDFSGITKKSRKYIYECFQCSLEILKEEKKAALLNGPISKKHFFIKNKFPGVTEFLANKSNIKNEIMLIYNNKISVSPITTHLPIKNVSKKIKKNKIIKNVQKLNKFYKDTFNKKIKFAILGLNPHCETNHKISEEQNEIIPAIKYLRNKKIYIKGPFSADTFFIPKNLNIFDVVIGMYHDQVLAPFKSIYNFNAINLTVGLPFIRVSPDHGPNNEMLGKNKSDPSSLTCAMDFLNRI